MNQMSVKVLLLLYSLFTLLFYPAEFSFIMALLCAVTCSCLCFFVETRSVKGMLLLLYCVLAFLFPALILFLPLILFDILEHRFYPLLFLVLCTVLFHFEKWDVKLGGFLLLGCLLSSALQYFSHRFEELMATYKKTRDDSMELTFLLREKNQNLLARQDYEIYAATLRERNRIAREIHDNVGHLLSRSILMVGALKTLQKESTLKEPLTQLDTTLNTAMDSIRQSVHDLHDDSIHLKEALMDLVHTFEFCPVSITYQMSDVLPRELKYSFISITKEALSNVIKHSSATHVSLQLKEFPTFYQYILEDNGKVTAPLSACGIGLINMQERIENRNGRIQFTTDHGFRIFITVPK